MIANHFIRFRTALLLPPIPLASRPKFPNKIEDGSLYRDVKIETRIRDEFFKTRCAILSLFLSLSSRVMKLRSRRGDATTETSLKPDKV